MTERELTDSMRDDAFDSVVLSKDMWEGDFDAYIFKHAIVEASTAVKGQCFRWLYRPYPAEQQFVHLDPDCRVYSDFSELRELLVTKPIVVCPHLVDPGNVQMEISSMPRPTTVKPMTEPEEKATRRPLFRLSEAA